MTFRVMSLCGSNRNLTCHALNFVKRGDFCFNNNFKNFQKVPYFAQRKCMSQWHLVSAVCLERKPKLIQEMSPLEKEYSEMADKIEVEKSLFSDHEMRHKEDMKVKEKLQKGEADDSDLEVAARQSALEFEVASKKELQNFQPAPRTTEADSKDDKKSLLRKLDHSLVLVIQQKLGNDMKWMLPQGVRQPEETMRQTAERILREFCGDTMKVLFLGNSPSGYYKYKYPKAARKEDGIVGAKVFFFKAQIRDGSICSETINSNKNAKDFLWLTRSELKDKLHREYHKAVEQFLIDEV